MLDLTRCQLSLLFIHCCSVRGMPCMWSSYLQGVYLFSSHLFHCLIPWGISIVTSNLLYAEFGAINKQTGLLLLNEGNNGKATEIQPESIAVRAWASYRCTEDQHFAGWKSHVVRWLTNVIWISTKNQVLSFQSSQLKGRIIHMKEIRDGE